MREREREKCPNLCGRCRATLLKVFPPNDIIKIDRLHWIVWILNSITTFFVDIFSNSANFPIFPNLILFGIEDNRPTPSNVMRKIAGTKDLKYKNRATITYIY